MKKYFKPTKQIFTNHNIAYFNNTCKFVSNDVRKQENRKLEFELGESLICKIRTKTSNNNILNVNYEYVVVKIIGNDILLKDNHKDEIYSIPITILRKNFNFNYCNTCHSLQGVSIEGAVIIYDWKNIEWANNRWLWTAITRVTELSNIYFYDGDKIECKLSFFVFLFLSFKLYP